MIIFLPTECFLHLGIKYIDIYSSICIIVYNYKKGAAAMLEISGKTNLLEQKSYKYSLQDVAEPNLQRDVFSYGSVPKVAFNHRRVPINMPE